MLRYEPIRMVAALRIAISNGDWTPTDEGRLLLGHISNCLAIPIDDEPQRQMRDGMLQVHVSDMLCHIKDEIAEGYLPGDIMSKIAADTAGQVRSGFDQSIAAVLALAA